MSGPLAIGEDAPDFEAETTEGRIRFHEWLNNSWHIFLPSERFYAGMHDRARDDGSDEVGFDKRNVKIIGLSVDPVDRHAGWSKDIEETQGYSPNYPMIGDAI